MSYSRRCIIDEGLRRDSTQEVGLGLVEVVISMFLIALLAIAFVPVLISGLRAAETNSTTATANRLVSQAIEAVRADQPDNCARLALLADTYPITEPDGEGVTIEVSMVVPRGAECSTGNANLVRVEARDQADDRLIASARTLVLLRVDTTP